MDSFHVILELVVVTENVLVKTIVFVIEVGGESIVGMIYLQLDVGNYHGTTLMYAVDTEDV